MFKTIHSQIEAARFGSGTNKTIYVFRQPGTSLENIQRPLHTNILIIGDITEPLREILDSSSRAQFQELIHLSKKGHLALKHYLDGRSQHQTNKTSQCNGYTHHTTGEGNRRIDLIVGDQQGRWEKLSNANILLVGVNRSRLKQVLLQPNGQSLAREFNMQGKTYEKLRKALHIRVGRGQRNAIQTTQQPA